MPRHYMGSLLAGDGVVVMGIEGLQRERERESYVGFSSQRDWGV